MITTSYTNEELKEMIFKLSGRRVKTVEQFHENAVVAGNQTFFEGRLPAANPSNTTVFYFGTLTLNADVAYSPITNAPRAIIQSTYPAGSPANVADINVQSGATAGLKTFDYQLFDLLFNFIDFHSNAGDSLFMRYQFTGYRIEVA